MKNVVITGGSAGIGYELVKLFSTHCIWCVITCSRTEEKNQILCSTAECVEASTIDLGKSEDRLRFIENSVIPKGTVNALVLNAAVTGIREIDRADNTPEYVREVNVKANKDMLDKTLPLLRKSNGVVIFVSSAISEEKDRDPVIDLYAQTKKEFEDYFTQTSSDPSNASVKFIIFRPGMIATRLHQRILQMKTGKLFERTKSAVENKQLKNPHIIAKIIKDYVEHPEKVKGLVQTITAKEYQKYLER